MPKRRDKETSRGRNEPFPVTHWTEIFTARSDKHPRRQAALQELLTTYWKPVYCYLRSKGCEKEAAKDLTQGFFYEVVLNRRLIQRADRTKGRFRTFLLTALDRYAANVHRARKTKQRMPKGGLVRLDAIDALNVAEPMDYTSPAEAFDYSWASALLDQVLGEVEGQCLETGNATHWKLFQARVLEPIMNNVEPLLLAHLCEKHGISNKVTGCKMVAKVKRIFRTALRRHVRQLVSSDAEVDAEIHHFIGVFSKSGGNL